MIIRKKWLIVILSILLIMSLILVGVGRSKRGVNVSTLPAITKVIAIDAGHGGVDPGAISKDGIKEKNINLAIAQYLKDYLEQSGAVVIMTRTEDKGLYSEGGSLRQKKNEDLRERKEIIKNSGADIFITIHLNSFPQTQYYGAQTFYPKDNPSSKKLADAVQGSLIETLDKKNTRVALSKEGVYIIKGLDIPTILVECGFLSNPKEAQLLNKPAYQEKIAWSIYTGIQKYFSENP